MARTEYPYRQALSSALRDIILDVGVPVINAQLTAQMEVAPPATIPQFGDASVRIGDRVQVSEPTICLVSAGRVTQIIGTPELFMYLFGTEIRVKLPSAGDNTPEDYEFVLTTVEDCLFDLFNQDRYAFICPTVPGSSPVQYLLPGVTDPGATQGGTFQDCLLLSSSPRNWPVVSAEGRTYTKGLTMTHFAQIPCSGLRPHPLGS